MLHIYVKEHVTLNQGVTSEEGKPVYDLIYKTLNSGDTVELDFDGMTFMTTAFLNVVIGTLYKDFTSEQLKERLILQNVSSDTAFRIKKVTDNAKLFYANQAAFNKNIDDAIYGNM